LAIALTALLGALPSHAAASFFSAGNEATIVTQTQRGLLGLKWWPDGPMGVEKTTTGYTFNASNGPNVARTTGTLDNPIGANVTPAVEITGARALTDVGYASGGPVYRAQATGMRLMFV